MYKVKPTAETREELEKQVRDVVEPVLSVLEGMGYDLTLEEWVSQAPPIWEEDHSNILGPGRYTPFFWEPIREAYRKLRGDELTEPPDLVRGLSEEEKDDLQQTQNEHVAEVARFLGDVVNKGPVNDAKTVNDEKSSE